MQQRSNSLGSCVSDRHRKTSLGSKYAVAEDLRYSLCICMRGLKRKAGFELGLGFTGRVGVFTGNSGFNLGL